MNQTKPEHIITFYPNIQTLKTNEPNKQHLNHLILIITNKRFIFIDQKSAVNPITSTISHDFSDLLNTETPKRALEILQILDIKDIVFPSQKTIEDKGHTNGGKMIFAIQIKMERDKTLILTNQSKDTFLSFRDMVSSSLNMQSASLNKKLNQGFSDNIKKKLEILVKDPAQNKLYQELVVNPVSKCMTHGEFFEQQDAMKENKRNIYISEQNKSINTKFYDLKKRINDEGEEVVCMTPEDKQRQFENFPGLKKAYDEKFLDNFGDRRDDEAKFWDDFWCNQKYNNTFLYGTIVEGKGIKSEMPVIPNQSNKMDIEFEANVREKVSVEFEHDIHEKYKLNTDIRQEEIDASNENLLKFINNHNAAVFRRDCGDTVVDATINRQVKHNENFKRNELEILDQELNFFSNQEVLDLAEKGQSQQAKENKKIAGYQESQNKILSINKPNHKVMSNEEYEMRKKAWGSFYETRKVNNIGLNDQLQLESMAQNLGIGSVGDAGFGDRLFDVQSDGHNIMRSSVQKQAINYSNREVTGNEYDKNFHEKLAVLTSKVYEILKQYYANFPHDKSDKDKNVLMRKLIDNMTGNSKFMGLAGELKWFKGEVDEMGIDENTKKKYKGSIDRIEWILQHTIDKSMRVNNPANR